MGSLSKRVTRGGHPRWADGENQCSSVGEAGTPTVTAGDEDSGLAWPLSGRSLPATSPHHAQTSSGPGCRGAGTGRTTTSLPGARPPAGGAGSSPRGPFVCQCGHFPRGQAQPAEDIARGAPHGSGRVEPLGGGRPSSRPVLRSSHTSSPSPPLPLPSVPPCLSLTHTHARAHTCTHTCTCTHAHKHHARAHTHTRTRDRAPAPACFSQTPCPSDRWMAVWPCKSAITCWPHQPPGRHPISEQARGSQQHWLLAPSPTAAPRAGAGCGRATRPAVSALSARAPRRCDPGAGAGRCLPVFAVSSASSEGGQERHGCADLP